MSEAFCFSYEGKPTIPPGITIKQWVEQTGSTRNTAGKRHYFKTLLRILNS